MLLIQQKSGITQRELLYHLLSGLKLVEENLLRYPEEIQLKEATFTFSIKKIRETGGKATAVIGFEHSDTREYGEVDSSTYEFGKKRPIRFEPSKFEWSEIGLNLQLEFAGQIMRDIADEVIASRETGVPLKSKKVERSYSITKTNTGSLEFKFLSDLVEVSASRKSAKTVTNNFKIEFGVKETDEKPPTSSIVSNK